MPASAARHVVHPQVRGIGDIDQARHDDRVLHDSAHATDAEHRRPRRTFDERVAFVAGLGVEAVDPQRHSIALECRALTQCDGIRRVCEWSVPESVERVERCSEHIQSPAPDALKRHAAVGKAFHQLLHGERTLRQRGTLFLRQNHLRKYDR